MLNLRKQNKNIHSLWTYPVLVSDLVLMTPQIKYSYSCRSQKKWYLCIPISEYDTFEPIKITDLKFKCSTVNKPVEDATLTLFWHKVKFSTNLLLNVTILTKTVHFISKNKLNLCMNFFFNNLQVLWLVMHKSKSGLSPIVLMYYFKFKCPSLLDYDMARSTLLSQPYTMEAISLKIYA